MNSSLNSELYSPKVVPSHLPSLALDAVVRLLFEVSWGKARGWIESGKVFVDDLRVTDSRKALVPGNKVELKMNAPKPRSHPDHRFSRGRRQAQQTEEANASGGASCLRLLPEHLIHLTSQFVVVNKPAGISSVPFEKGDAPSLVELTAAYLQQANLEVVQRLDRETSGLMVFARNRDAARGLGNQFRFHTVHRRYLALVHGRVRSGTIRSTLILDRGDGLRGSARPGWKVAHGEGKEAITHVTVLKHFGARASLIECHLETGRTHQIRIHLSEAGHPLLGEKLYNRDFPLEKQTWPEGPKVSRVMLHAAELGFDWPTGRLLEPTPRAASAKRPPLFWEVPPPADFQLVLAELDGGPAELNRK